jgi:phage/plasmid-associated DNA primase
MPTNYVPNSADKAVQGRLDLLPFQNVPKKLDRSVKLHLETDKEAHEAVLTWAMSGLIDYLTDREKGNEQPLGETPWLDALVARYAHESDALLDFLESCFETTDAPPLRGDEDDGSPHTDTVYWAYEIWAQDNVKKEQVLKKRVFAYALEERGFIKARVPSHGGTMRWRGLRWKPREEWPASIQAAVTLVEQQLAAVTRAQGAGL